MSASRNGEGGIGRAGGNGSASVGGGTSSRRRHRVVRSQPARRGGTRLLYARLERLVSDSINGVCLDAFGYGLNYLIDIKYAVIVDVEATPAPTYDEVGAGQIDHCRSRKPLFAIIWKGLRQSINHSHFSFSGTNGDSYCGLRPATRRPSGSRVTEALPGDGAPKYLIRDNDRAFGGVFKARVRAMGVRDGPITFHSP